MTTGGFAAGLVGIVLDGRYRLEAVLGEGGMGSVFRAHHLAMDRKVAVKLLKPHLTTDAQALQRFAREARATLKVESPHAVKVLDFGVTPQNDYYMVLEYLDGRTVQRELEVDGPFAPARVLHIARHALHALGAAHKSGLVHRDIKPDNILLMRVDSDPDYAMLLDFGVAKLMQGAAVSDRSRFALTQAGMVFGTPEYMSPEQACGHPLDGRSDIYSLAATMFAMLTGCALFDGKTAIELLTHHARTPPPHLEMLVPELGQYPRLDELIQRCLAKKREQRPGSAEELDQLLEQLEGYVSRAGKSNKSMKVTQLAGSSFFEALPAEMVDPGKTLLPADFAPPEPTFKVPTLGPDDSPPLASRRGLYLAIGGVAVLAMVGIAIGIAMSKKSKGAEPPPPSDATSNLGKVVPAPPLDAMTADAPSSPVDATTAIDAAVSVPVRHDGGSKIVPPPPKTNEHLKAAEEAMKQGNRLRQLAEADLALQADPRSVRAKYLLADALIKGGDLDRGCAYLRELGRNPLAVARANVAKCSVR